MNKGFKLIVDLLIVMVENNPRERRQQIKPDEDIDLIADTDKIRIERLSENSVYIAGYTNEDEENDYRYWINCTNDGLLITEEIVQDYSE